MLNPAKPKMGTLEPWWSMSYRVSVHLVPTSETLQEAMATGQKANEMQETISYVEYQTPSSMSPSGIGGTEKILTVNARLVSNQGLSPLQ